MATARAHTYTHPHTHIHKGKTICDWRHNTFWKNEGVVFERRIFQKYYCNQMLRVSLRVSERLSERRERLMTRAVRTCLKTKTFQNCYFQNLPFRFPLFFASLSSLSLLFLARYVFTRALKHCRNPPSPLNPFSNSRKSRYFNLSAGVFSSCASVALVMLGAAVFSCTKRARSRKIQRKWQGDHCAYI